MEGGEVGDATALIVVVAVVDVAVRVGEVVGVVVMMVLFGISLVLLLWRHLLLIRLSCPKKETTPQRGRRTQSPSPACLRTRTGTRRLSPRRRKESAGARKEEGEWGGSGVWWKGILRREENQNWDRERVSTFQADLNCVCFRVLIVSVLIVTFGECVDVCGYETKTDWFNFFSLFSLGVLRRLSSSSSFFLLCVFFLVLSTLCYACREIGLRWGVDWMEKERRD